MRCVLSHNGYGCKAGTVPHDVHEGADGHTWTTEESWGYPFEEWARETLKGES